MWKKHRELYIILLFIIAGFIMISVVVAQQNSTENNISKVTSSNADLILEKNTAIQGEKINYTVDNIGDNSDNLVIIDEEEFRRVYPRDTGYNSVFDQVADSTFLQKYEDISILRDAGRTSFAFDKYDYIQALNFEYSGDSFTYTLDTTHFKTGNIEIQYYPTSVFEYGVDPPTDKESIDIQKPNFTIEKPVNYTLGSSITVEGSGSKYFDKLGVYVRNRSDRYWYRFSEVELDTRNRYSVNIDPVETLDDIATDKAKNLFSNQRIDMIAVVDPEDADRDFDDVVDKKLNETEFFYSITEKQEIKIQKQQNEDKNKDRQNNYNLSINTEPKIPEGNVSININAEKITALSLNQIPDNWTIQSIDSSGGVGVRGDPDDDGSNESVSIAYTQKQSSVNPTVELYVPENTEKSSYTLNVSVRDGETVSKEFTIEVGGSIIDRYDENSNGRIDSNEIRQAIRDYLFKDSISQEDLKTLIREFILSG